MPTNIVPMLPDDCEDLYRRAVDELDIHLAADDATGARTMLCGFVERVVVHGGNSPGRQAGRMHLYGNLYRLPGGVLKRKSSPAQRTEE